MAEEGQGGCKIGQASPLNTELEGDLTVSFFLNPGH